MAISVRMARKEDMQNVLDMIQEMANLHQKPNAPQLKPEDLIRDGGFDESSNGAAPAFFCFIGELTENNSQLSPNSEDVSTVGYALCFNIYSSFKGKALYMIGLYVKPDHRRNGVGKHLFEKVINFARETNCNHLDFHVMAGNPAQEFYAKLHAKNLTEESGYLVYRLTKDQIYETSDEI